MTMNLLLTAAALMLALAAVAEPGDDKKPAAPATINCAVMTRRTVEVKTATSKHMYADYQGRRYFFCCSGCPVMFRKDPEKYAKNASLPTPEQDRSAP